MKRERRASTVSLLDVAHEAGVSRATASLVLRNSPLVAASTREKVQAAMLRLGYIYNRGAANLRQKRTGTIGLVLSNIANPFFSTLTAGVEEVNDTQEIVSIIANSGESPARQTRQIQRLREHNIDGLIICPAIGSDAGLIADLDRLGLPFVQVLREVPDAQRDYVTADYAAGIGAALAYLDRIGRKRVVYVGNMETHSAALARVQGFREAAAHLGMSDVAIVNGTKDSHYDERVFEALLDSSDPPEAAICYNDIIALALMNQLHRRGVRVGGHDRDGFAVIGMDDLAAAAAAYPALTTIATMPRLIGAAAARLLQKRMARPARAYEKQVIAPELILRESA
ncbi:LacI family DNA-binding transcriptional regulator [Asaia bogorensis]|uniref:LacI family DNA-binding transcriptional regulator n=1 Tax=Asaia bogorensis TaxID=91915 RepID=UPI000EFB7072|nr:LacI family DNA-binding transcriptional regulator [Asaia bogorensis]